MERKIQPAYFALFIPICSMLIAGSFLLHYESEYKTADKEYQELSDKYTHGSTALQLKNTSDNETNNGPSSQEDYPDPLAIEWDKLISINPEITGWISFPLCGISYPVVQGDDNTKYLKMTFEGTQNASGAIFMDCQNKPDYTDKHTLLYGHNMKDRSMFGGLKPLRKDPALVKTDPYFYIQTPDGRTRQYRIFATREVNADSEAYILFDNPSVYDDFIQKCINASPVNLSVGTDFSTRLPIVTLSTCSGDGRFLIHGVLVAIY